MIAGPPYSAVHIEPDVRINLVASLFGMRSDAKYGYRDLVEDAGFRTGA